jgi:hypothetical protein
MVVSRSTGGVGGVAAGAFILAAGIFALFMHVINRKHA